jgi:predicted nucleic acid-binding Zn ribbon protein
MKNKQAASIGDILPAVFKRLGLEEKVEEGRLTSAWPAVVGEALARRSRPRGVKRGVLVVEAENNVWMQELRFHQAEILDRVRERFPKLAVKGIRLELERERGHQ